MKFKTISGSIYEVDEQGKKIRRLYGTEEATSRQGKDGDWKSFDHLDLEVGASAMIFWDAKTTPLLEGNTFGGSPATMTSQVAEIIDESSVN